MSSLLLIVSASCDVALAPTTLKAAGAAGIDPTDIFTDRPPPDDPPFAPGIFGLGTDVISFTVLKPVARTPPIDTIFWIVANGSGSVDLFASTSVTP